MLETLRAHLKAQPIPAVPHACTPGVDCDDCPNRDHVAAALPLCLVRPGQRARIVQVEHGQRFRKRLADLGLAPGMELRVMQASHLSGPLILAVRCDARIALGWGMAKKIQVELIPG
ncbi:MAG: ferrous iron transport protein A [Chloroflexi bacterium]|nr:ferrous iron transport protein A [Chloroflexota bacterium]